MKSSSLSSRLGLLAAAFLIFAFAPLGAAVQSVQATGGLPAAGSVRPAPPGNIASSSGCPTCTTPTQIAMLPYTISTPGFYCVAGDLASSGDLIGILVTTPNVVIDLSGHVLDGGGVGSVGILTDEDNVTVRNGSLTGWNAYGVQVGRFACVEDIDVYWQAGNGIEVQSVSSVSRCRVWNVGVAGITTVGSQISIRQCDVRQAATTGILGGDMGLIADCTVRIAEKGILGQRSSIVDRCVVADCSLVGIQVFDGSLVRDCLVGASSDGSALGNGIQAGIGTRVVDCVARMVEGQGINATETVRVSGAVISDVGGIGITGGQNVAVESSSVSRTDGTGVNLLERGTLLDSVVTAAQAGGVYMPVEGLARGNYVSNCAASAVTVHEGARVEGNHLTSSDEAVQTFGIDSLIFANSSFGNTQQYLVPANNTIGPIGTMQDWIHAMNPWLNFHLDF